MRPLNKCERDELEVLRQRVLRGEVLIYGNELCNEYRKWIDRRHEGASLEVLLPASEFWRDALAGIRSRKP